MKFLYTVVTYQPCVNCENENINLHREAMELGWGETLENGHLNQQPVVAGLLVAKVFH